MTKYQTYLKAALVLLFVLMFKLPTVNALGADQINIFNENILFHNADGPSSVDGTGNSCFDGTHSTAFGQNFSDLIQSLGGTPGVLVPKVSWSLPQGWPTW